MKKHHGVVLITFFIGLILGYTLPYNNDEVVMEHGESIHNEHMDMQNAMDMMIVDSEGKTVEEYEKAFLEMMIIHHEGAITMAEDLLLITKRPELVKLANDIISTQNEEVELMSKWKTEWFE